MAQGSYGRRAYFQAKLFAKSQILPTPTTDCRPSIATNHTAMVPNAFLKAHAYKLATCSGEQYLERSGQRR